MYRQCGTAAVRLRAGVTRRQRRTVPSDDPSLLLHVSRTDPIVSDGSPFVEVDSDLTLPVLVQFSDQGVRLIRGNQLDTIPGNSLRLQNGRVQCPAAEGFVHSPQPSQSVEQIRLVHRRQSIEVRDDAFRRTSQDRRLVLTDVQEREQPRYESGIRADESMSMPPVDLMDDPSDPGCRFPGSRSPCPCPTQCSDRIIPGFHTPQRQPRSPKRLPQHAATDSRELRGIHRPAASDRWSCWHEMILSIPQFFPACPPCWPTLSHQSRCVDGGRLHGTTSLSIPS